MNPVLKLYLKIAVRAGTTFAVLLLCSDLILEGTVYPLKILFFFVFIGVIYSIATVSFHVEKIKGLGVQNLTDAALKSTQIRRFCLDMKEIELIEALLNDPTFGGMSLSKKGNTIRLRSGIEGESLGTMITLTLIDEREGHMYMKLKVARVYLQYTWIMEKVSRILWVLNGFSGPLGTSPKSSWPHRCAGGGT